MLAGSTYSLDEQRVADHELVVDAEQIALCATTCSDHASARPYVRVVGS
jgi:hypothetical protein